MAHKKKYCDLNVIVSSLKKENIDNVKRLVKLGFKVVALNHRQPQPSREIASSKLPVVEKALSLNKEILEELKLMSYIKENDFHLPDDFVLLTRATFPVSDNDQIRLFRMPFYKNILQSFDLIALEPENEKIFRAITENKFEVDIIVIPLENRNTYDIPRKLINVSVDANLKFELSYSKAIKSLSLRKTIFHNSIKTVYKIKNHKGIILSSGGERCLDFRSPADIINMASLFEIKDKSSQDVVSVNCLQAVLHGRIRSKSFLGCVSVEKDSSSHEPPTKRQKVQ